MGAPNTHAHSKVDLGCCDEDAVFFLLVYNLITFSITFDNITSILKLKYASDSTQWNDHMRLYLRCPERKLGSCQIILMFSADWWEG